MKFLKWLIIIVVAIILLLGVVSFFLPTGYRVTRLETIQAPPDSIYSYLVDLKQWPGWTVWNKEMDPTAVYEFSEPTSGVGAMQKWSGEKMGKGMLTIIKAEPNRGVWYELSFEDGQFVSNGEILLDPDGGSTKISWANYGDMGGNPLWRYFNLMADRMMGDDFANGLKNLKGAVEKTSGKP